MSYATRLNQRLQSNANQGFGYTNQKLGYANQGINYENQGINYANNAIGKGNLYSNQGHNGLTQYDNDLYDQSYQSMGYGYQPYNTGVVNRQGFSDYPDYSDISIVRAPSRTSSSSSCLYGGVNPLLALIIVAGAALGFYVTYTKLQSINKRGFNFNSVEHLLDMLWNG